MSPTGNTLLGYGALVLFFFAYPVLWLLLIFRVHVSSDVAWWLAVFPHVCLVLFLGWCVRQLLLAKTQKRVLLWVCLPLASLLGVGWNFLLIGGMYMR